MTEFELAEERLGHLGLSGTVRPGQYFIKTRRVYNGGEGIGEHWVCYTTDPSKARKDLVNYLTDHELADTQAAAQVISTLRRLSRPT